MEQNDAVLVDEKGIHPITPDNGTDFSLAELKDNIKCKYVERVALKGGNEMWIDEEGKILDKYFNIVATGIFLESYPPSGDYIVGNAIICKKGMVK